LLTGASSGLGRATAVALAEAGADVALLARSRPDIEQVAARIAAMGREALVLPTDLADEGQTVAAAERAIASLGRVDVLVNIAATDVPAPVADLGTQDWDRVLAVNLRAPFLLARSVFTHMRRAGGGTIVNVSSVAGKRGWSNAAAYCASKFGLTGLTQALAAEGRPFGIRACAVYPGAMATSWGMWTAEDRRRTESVPVPPTKALPVEDVAALIVWIASAPPQMVLNETVVTPLEEHGWP
jgi:NAD(P)-dependent dehydrogenase (short-subunit alcohol dehydrogenase family)